MQFYRFFGIVNLIVVCNSSTTTFHKLQFDLENFGFDGYYYEDIQNYYRERIFHRQIDFPQKYLILNGCRTGEF